MRYYVLNIDFIEINIELGVLFLETSSLKLTTNEATMAVCKKHIILFVNNNYVILSGYR